MVLRVPLLFEGSKSSKNLYALFDSGATYSCLNEDRAEELEIFTPLHTPMKLATASENVFMKIHNSVCVDFYKNDSKFSDEFLVVPNLSEEVIIGAATIRKWRIKLDFKNNAIVIDPRISKPILIHLMSKD